MPYIEKVIRSGKLLEKETYFSTRYGSKLPRNANVNQTPADMEKVNERRSMKRLQRLICTNFASEDGDLFVTYTYGAPVCEAEAARGERNLLDRIRRLRKRKGLEELKYIVVTEKQGQWHHHIIMNGGLTLEEIRKVWGDRGARIHMSTLDDTAVCEGLARYLTEQHKPKKGQPVEENNKQERRKGQRRWHASRNLKEPVEETKVLKREPKLKEPKAPKGYALIKDSVVMGYDVYGMTWSYAAFVMIENRSKAKPPEGGMKSSRISKERAKRTTEGVRGRSPGGLEGRALRVQVGKGDGA